MNLACIICYVPADVLFDGYSFCRGHFEEHFTYFTKSNYSASIVEMKKKYGQVVADLEDEDDEQPPTVAG